jgi:hypothetical protein
VEKVFSFLSLGHRELYTSRTVVQVTATRYDKSKTRYWTPTVDTSHVLYSVLLYKGIGDAGRDELGEVWAA